MTTLDELEAIRARHWVAGQYVTLALDAGQQAHADRATLLRLLDAAREELREVREAAGPVVIYADVFDRHVLDLSGKTHDSTPVATVTKWGGENQDVQIPVAHLYIGDLRRLAAALQAPPTRAQGESS
jgi:hypothetical protein